MKLSRRKIIRVLGLAAGTTAAGLIPGVSLFAGKAIHSDENGIPSLVPGPKAILIGAGKRGNRFARFAQKNPDQLSIAAIGEIHEERRIHLGKALGLSAGKCLDHSDEVFSRKPEAEVVIITASGSYWDICSKALNAGYHVWVDKPVSIDPEKVIAINRLASENKRQLLFCYIHEGKLNFMDHHLFEKNPAKV